MCNFFRNNRRGYYARACPLFCGDGNASAARFAAKMKEIARRYSFTEIFRARAAVYPFSVTGAQYKTPPRFGFFAPAKRNGII